MFLQTLQGANAIGVGGRPPGVGPMPHFQQTGSGPGFQTGRVDKLARVMLPKDWGGASGDGRTLTAPSAPIVIEGGIDGMVMPADQRETTGRHHAALVSS